MKTANKIQIGVSADEDVFRFIAKRAKHKGVSKSAIANEFLRAGIKEFIRRVKVNKQHKKNEYTNIQTSNLDSGLA